MANIHTEKYYKYHTQNRNYVNETRRWLKEHHYCRDCKKKDAYTLAGRTYCADCAEKMRMKKRINRQDPVKHEKMLQSKRDQLQRYREQNKCLHCGKDIADGKTLCALCIAKQREYSKKSRERNNPANPRGENGICWQCNKNPCMEGKKICSECYEWKVKIANQNLQIAHSNNSQHPWGKSICQKINK